MLRFLSRCKLPIKKVMVLLGWHRLIFPQRFKSCNKKPVVPHWKGEVGLCTDFFQLAHRIFAQTKNIEVGSAVMSICATEVPSVWQNELQTLYPSWIESRRKRRLHIGFRWSLRIYGSPVWNCSTR